MFKFKGISSEDMQIVVEEEEHFIARAAQRYEITEIDGKDGAKYDELGYSVVERPIYIQCLNVDKVDEILAWLDGEGELEYKGRKTIARFYSELDPLRSSCIRIIDTTFTRDPFWYKANETLLLAKDRKDRKASGKNINLTDSAEAKITELKISGNSNQETRDGIMPSSNYPSEIKTVGDNINVFDGELEIGSFDNFTGAKSNNDGSIRSINYIPVKPNTEYTISNDLNYHQYIYEYTSDYKYIKYTANTNNPFTFITSETTKYLMFRSTAGTMQNDLNVKYKLERGATATSYSSYGQGNINIVIDNNLDLSESNYKCQNYTIPVQEEMLEGDILNWDNEEEVHTWGKYIITGDENWKKHTATNNNSFYWETFGIITNISLPINNNEKGIIKNTHYKNYAVNNIVFNNIIGTGLAVGPVFYITTGLDGISTISDFKTWLKSQYEAGTPVTMYYKLLEEKRIPFTEEQKEIAKQIINNAKTYDKATHIYSTDNISSNLEVAYLAITNEKIDNQGNIQSRPLLRLEKTIFKEVELTINNIRFKYNFENDNYVEINCEEKTVEYEGLIRNRRIAIGPEFPKLNVGSNKIVMHEGDCIIKILRKDRWL